MNCKQLNTIRLEEVLCILGHLPTKENEKEAWFLNPFIREIQASFKLDKRLNLWYLFSEGIGGNTVDFLMKYFNFSIPEVLYWAEEQSFSSFHQPITETIQPSYTIHEVINLKSKALKQYLSKRGLSSRVYKLLREIHFSQKGKTYFAIGFQNISGGWEIRNKFFKGSFLKKDISVLENKNNESKKVHLFEGFIDALSFIEMNRKLTGDVVVLNSVALIERVKKHLVKYEDIHLYLDNDNAGIKCKKNLMMTIPSIKDESNTYAPMKDFNDYWISILNQRKEKRKSSSTIC